MAEGHPVSGRTCAVTLRRGGISNTFASGMSLYNKLSAGGGGVLLGSNSSGSGSESLRSEGVGVRPPRGGVGYGASSVLRKVFWACYQKLEVKKMESCRELNR